MDSNPTRHRRLLDEIRAIAGRTPGFKNLHHDPTWLWGAHPMSAVLQQVEVLRERPGWRQASIERCWELVALYDETACEWYTYKAPAWITDRVEAQEVSLASLELMWSVGVAEAVRRRIAQAFGGEDD